MLWLSIGMKKPGIKYFALVFLNFVGLFSCQKIHDTDQNNYSRMLWSADSLRYSEPSIADSLYRTVITANTPEKNSLYVSASIGLSLVQLDMGMIDSAGVMLGIAKDLVIQTPDTGVMLEYYLAEGYYYTQLEDLDNSEKSYKLGYEIAKKSNNEKYKHIFHLNLGEVMIENGNYAEATRILNDELNLAEHSGFTSHIAVCFKNLANIAYLTNDIEKAIFYGKKSGAIFRNLNMTSEYSSILMNLGIYYRNVGLYDSSLFVYRQANELMAEMGDSMSMIKVKYNIANILKATGKAYEAEDELKQVYKYCVRHGISTGKVYAHSGLSDIYFRAGNPEKGLAAIDTALKQALQNNLINDLVNLYDIRHLNLARVGRFEESYHSLNEARRYSDSLLSIEKQKEILGLQTRYETERKEAENVILKKDVQVKKTRLWFQGIVIIAGTLLMVIITGIFIMRHRKLRHLRQIAIERNTRLEAENRERKTELDKKELEALLKEEQIEKLNLQAGLKEQELVFQSLARAELKQILDSVQEKLVPMHTRFSRKKDQDEFMNIISELSRGSKKDPLSEFEMLFKNLHPGFYEKLLAVNPTLSKSELLVSAMIRLNLSSKDIVNLVNLSLATIESTRSHIRKKLNLDMKDNLTTYLLSV